MRHRVAGAMVLALALGACVEDRGIGGVVAPPPDETVAPGSPSFLAPRPGDVLSGVVAVAIDPGADDARGVHLLLDGNELGSRAGTPWSMDLDTTLLADGVALLEVEVDGADGAVRTAEVAVRIDNDASAVEILEPLDGTIAYVEDGPLRFAVRVRDRAGVARVELRAGGTSVALFAPPTREELGADIDVAAFAPDLAPGETVPVRLEVEVEDESGHLTVEALGIVVATRLLWRFDTLGRIETPPVALADGAVAVGSFDGNLYVVEGDGTERCRVETGEEIVGGPALMADGTGIVFGTTRRVRAVDATTCAVRWTYGTEGVWRGGPTVMSDGVVLAVEFNGSLHAIAANGAARWHVSLDGEGIAAPAVGPDGTIVVGSLSGTLHAFASDGTPRWTLPTGAGIGAPALVTADAVYVGSYDFYVYAVDLAGQPLWDYEFATDADVQCAPGLLPSGDLAMCSRDGNVYAIDGATGEERWRFGTAGITYGGVALGPDGTILVGVADGSVQAIAPTGQARWRFDTHEAVVARPAPSGDVVFVASTDRRLYALWAAP